MGGAMDSCRGEFESAFRESVGVAAARAVGRGREALYVLLKALGVGDGDRVGVIGYTCLSVVEPVLLTGAAPVYLDIDSYANIDPASLEELAPGSLKVVILQYTWGVPGRLCELLEQCRRIGAAVVEDCAHAYGSSWDGTPLGRFGDGAIFSLGWAKPMSAGAGGLVTVNSRTLLDRVDAGLERAAVSPDVVSSLAFEAQRKVFHGAAALGAGLRLKMVFLELARRGILSETFEMRGPKHRPPRYVKRMDERTARAGLALLAGWPRVRDRRREGAELIRKRLAEASLPPWPIPCMADVTMLVYPMLAANKSPLIAEAHRRGLDVHGWYENPVHPMGEPGWRSVGYEPGSCPWGEKLGRHVVHVPPDSPALARSVEYLVARLSRANPRPRRG